MANKQMELEHAKTFVDVLFGVLIALPLTEVLPPSVSNMIVSPSLSSAISILLLAAALSFSTFYWLEVRRFIDEQSKFDQAIRGTSGLSRGRLFGGLIMVALVAAILKFAKGDTFQPFLITNLLFWLADFFGNVGLKRKYQQTSLDSINRNSDEYEWYTTHIGSYKYILYSILNVAFFGLVLVLNYALPAQEVYRFIVASLVFVFTLFRHLFWRAKL
jgi:hypothetical protein